MTRTLDDRLRTDLAGLADAIPVPPVDRDSLRTRVVRARRRRNATRVAAAGGVAATVLVGAAWAVQLAAGADLGPPTAATDPTADTLDGVPVTLDGTVKLLRADGSLQDTGRTGAFIGRYDGHLVSLDDGRLAGVADHEPTGVTAAFAKDDGAVTYQTARGIVRVDAGGPRGLAGTGRLLAADQDSYVTADATGVVVHVPDGDHAEALGSDGTGSAPRAADISGSTVALLTGDSEQFIGTDGGRHPSLLGGGTGALSPTGSTWAYAPDRREQARGMTRGLAFYDVASGRLRRVPLTDPAIDVAWSDDSVYVVTQAAGQRTLWQCRATGCQSRFVTDDLTLALH